jgi:hypothetical protein
VEELVVQIQVNQSLLFSLSRLLPSVEVKKQQSSGFARSRVLELGQAGLDQILQLIQLAKAC